MRPCADKLALAPGQSPTLAINENLKERSNGERGLRSQDVGSCHLCGTHCTANKSTTRGTIATEPTRILCRCLKWLISGGEGEQTRFGFPPQQSKHTHSIGLDKAPGNFYPKRRGGCTSQLDRQVDGILPHRSMPTAVVETNLANIAQDVGADTRDSLSITYLSVSLSSFNVCQ